MSRTYSSIWPKVVLHILWDGGFGGAQKFIRDIAVYSDKNKFQHVIVFLAVGGPLSKEISSRGVIVYVLGMRSGFSLIKGLRLFKIINKFKPDIIHNHFRNYIANLIILFFRGIPKVYIEHGGEWLEGESFKQIIFYNCFVRFYDLVLVNSNYVKGEIVRLTGVKPKRFETLYIGINAVEYSDASIDRNLLKKEFDIAVEDRVIGIVGRLIKRKGIDDFIKVASYINRIEKRCS